MKRRHDVIREIGCIICLSEGYSYCPCSVHHMDGSTTQAKHAKTLGLCYKHHTADQDNPPNIAYTSRHPNKKAFENRYDTEVELLIVQNQLIAGYENEHGYRC